MPAAAPPRNVLRIRQSRRSKQCPSGAYHDFDLYESIRSAAVNQAVEQFTARVSAFPA